jgi:hypothetical protein
VPAPRGDGLAEGRRRRESPADSGDTACFLPRESFADSDNGEVGKLEGDFDTADSLASVVICSTLGNDALVGDFFCTSLVGDFFCTCCAFGDTCPGERGERGELDGRRWGESVERAGSACGGGKRDDRGLRGVFMAGLGCRGGVVG